MPWELERLKAPIRSIGSSLNRRLSGVWSTGFTRTVSIFGKVAVIASVARVVAGPCACAASDHAAAAPPNRLVNSRLMVSSIGDAAASRSRPRGASGRAWRPPLGPCARCQNGTGRIGGGWHGQAGGLSERP